MSRSVTVKATDFARNFAHYQDEAIAAKVINVTSHGRIVGGFLSAAELALYETLKRRERSVLLTADLASGDLEAIATAEYGSSPR